MMLWILIIALVCGVTSIFFILAEINQGINTWRTLTNNMRWYEFYKAPYYLVLSLIPILIDVGITSGVVILFGMKGMLGMMVSLTASACVSGYLFFKKPFKQRSRYN